jgi:hypothetical protein
MAFKQFYAGSDGPLIYNDATQYYSGNLAGIYHHALVTEGQIYVLGIPTLPYHMIRKTDQDTLKEQLRNKAYFFSSF